MTVGFRQKMAVLATSAASARVGRGAWIIDSKSIWVATMTSLACNRAFSMICALDRRNLLKRALDGHIATSNHERRHKDVQ